MTDNKMLLKYNGCFVEVLGEGNNRIYIPRSADMVQVDHNSQSLDSAKWSIDSFLKYGDVLADPDYSMPG